MKPHNHNKILSENLFPVVGIGASAGGLEAFKTLLRGIPVKSGMAYILVQHLDPNFESILTDLLQKVTKVPVVEITDNVHVEPDHIYIIPSNKLLTATDGILQLTARPVVKQNMPIDLFFSSLAEVHQSHAIGVILSGMGTDGTAGLKKIKEQGGVTFAQNPGTAAYQAMPLNAINADVVDHVISAEDIPSKILALQKNLKRAKKGRRFTGDYAGDEQAQILALIFERHGVDFTFYKEATITRRILRRMDLTIKNSLGEYLKFLRDHPEEQETLFQDLIISVTEFMRDPKVFDTLSQKVFPVMLRHFEAKDTIRIWVAGCSTGEEVYSIIICLLSYMEDTNQSFTIQLFATDISEKAVARARAGIYKKSEISGLSAAQVKKYFTKLGEKYVVNKPVREVCIFAVHNYLTAPPFSKMDMISCRNSLIYLEPVLQKKALATFHYALNENGFLVLGKSETAGQAAELFTPFDKTHKIYSKKAAPERTFNPLHTHHAHVFKKVGNKQGAKDRAKDNFEKNADEILLAKFAPAGVIVDVNMDILQFRGATGMWLEPSPGRPNLNLLKMARQGLSFELRSALHHAKIKKEPYIKEHIPISIMGSERLVTIEVIPLLHTMELHFLVLFKDFTPKNNTHSKLPEGDENQSSIPSPDRKEQQIRALKQEIEQLREDMRSITEDQEASNEELQSANEELLSGSEELQSLNEELVTSKEEIQTTNEELIVVNQELYDRNEQLNFSRKYAESIISTIREPLLVLDKNMVIRTANTAFYTNFRTSVEETEGKTLFSLGDQQWDVPALRMLLENLLPHKTRIDNYEVNYHFTDSTERILLLNASKIYREHNEEELILLFVEDITEKKRILHELKVFSEKLEEQVLQRTMALHASNIDLQYSNKNLEQFAYIASHDLQEPLRKIKTFSSLLEVQYSDELSIKAKEIVAKIVSSSDRMSTLIKDVLNFSKVLYSTDAFVKTDLDKLLDQICVDFELMIEEKNAVIHRDRLPVIEAIPLQISQLFYNLISNALKYSRNDLNPVINITNKYLAENELLPYQILNKSIPHCEITITDNGIGFDAKHAEKIFLIFHRLHGRSRYAGTGIGLALCKTIVVHHHGEIWAESDVNQGASFKIILPLYHVNRDNTSEAEKTDYE